MRSFLRRRGPLLAYLALAVALAYALWQIQGVNDDRNAEVRSSQVAGCERTNDFRSQINDQSADFLRANQITYRLFIDVAKVLPPNSTLADRIDEAVVDYQRIEKSYTPLEIISCQRAYPGVN